MLAVIALLSLFMGSVLGLLGGGGSILTVPILAYVAGMPAGEAIASSLVVVGITSLVGAANHARHGNVDLPVGITFGAVAMLGAFIGGRVAAYVPGWILLGMFAGLMLVTAFFMLRKARGSSTHTPKRASMPLIVVEGLAVGAVTGLVGAGGGFLVVPALVLLGGLPMHRAIGTSLLVIAMKSAAAVAGHISHVQIDWQLTALVGGFAIAGSIVGARYAKRVPANALRTVFAWFVLVMGTFILSKELLPIVGTNIAIGAPLLALGIAAWVARPSRSTIAIRSHG